MIARIFGLWPLLFLLIFAVVAFVVGIIVGWAKGDKTSTMFGRGGEAALLAFVGGLLARSFISVILGIGDDSSAATLTVGWGFLLWPGAIDTIPHLIGKSLFGATSLIWIASGVGAFVGMMDGAWRIHDWKGLGWLGFPLDVTWGLAGSTNGCLLHLVNFAWAGHRNTERKNAHAYDYGFRIKSGYAFTQGSVMSEMHKLANCKLFEHESTHVWQNRIFGPFFVLSYLGWMVVFLIPGLIAGLIAKIGLLGIEKWCYMNNPWEAWAYRIGCGPRGGTLVWGDLAVLLASIPFFGLWGLMTYFILAAW